MGSLIRRLALAVAAVCGALYLGSAAQAYDGMNVEYDRTDALTTMLGLSEAQQGQVRQVIQEHMTRRQALKEQLNALTQEQDAKIRALLTPEQQAKFDVWTKEKARFHGGVMKSEYSQQGAADTGQAEPQAAEPTHP